MGILNVPFCSIFVPFHFCLILTLVVPCLDNIYIYIYGFADLRSALGNFKIGATKPIFLDSGSPRGGGGFMHAWAWFVVRAWVWFVIIA